MKTPLVTGSTGQPTLNPLLKEASELAGKLLTLERDYGLTPKSWVDLGGALGDATRSLANINADLADDEPDEDFTDPRLTAMDGRPR
jgi:phage terminase small subunit